MLNSTEHEHLPKPLPAHCLRFLHHKLNARLKSRFLPNSKTKNCAFAKLHSRKVNLSLAIVTLCRDVRSNGVSRRLWC